MTHQELHSMLMQRFIGLECFHPTCTEVHRVLFRWTLETLSSIEDIIIEVLAIDARKKAVGHLFVIQDTVIRLEVKILKVIKQMLSREKTRSAKIK